MEKLKQDLQNYQINSKTYVKYDTDGLNQYQNYLYKRALYITISYSNFIFKTLFPNSPITEYLLSDTETDTSFKNTLTFRDLDINKDKIITIFISEGILPRNFLSLELPQNQLPRLKNESKS